MSILIPVGLFVLQMFLILSFGVLVQKLIKYEAKSLVISWIIGVFSMFAVFGLATIIATLSQLPLSYLTAFWTVVSILVVGYVILSCHSAIKKMIIKFIMHVKEQGILLSLLLFAVLVLQMWIIIVYIDNSPDGSYYIGSVTTNVYTNSLGLYEPLTGEALTQFSSRYLFACFQNYNCVMSQLFHIHPLMQAKLIMPEIVIVLVNMVYYAVGNSLFKNDRKKTVVFIIFMFVFNWFSNTGYTSSTFLFTRTYEGKAILGNLVIMGMIYCFINIWQGKDNLLHKVILLAISISSFIFSSSAMLIVPVGMTAGFFTWIIKEKCFKDIIWYLSFVLPNVLVAGVYLLSVKGLITFTIR